MPKWFSSQLPYYRILSNCRSQIHGFSTGSQAITLTWAIKGHLWLNIPSFCWNDLSSDRIHYFIFACFVFYKVVFLFLFWLYCLWDSVHACGLRPFLHLFVSLSFKCFYCHETSHYVKLSLTYYFFWTIMLRIELCNFK